MISKLNIVKLDCCINPYWFFFFLSRVDCMSKFKVFQFGKEIIFKAQETRPENNVRLYCGKWKNFRNGNQCSVMVRQSLNILSSVSVT